MFASIIRNNIMNYEVGMVLTQVFRRKVFYILSLELHFKVK